jgi:hemerythrin superfamily protein
MKDIGQSIKKTFNLEAFMGSEPAMIDAVDILKADHRRVDKLFKAFPKADLKQRKEMLDTIIKELSVHARIEENLVYPLIMDQENDKTMEAYEEHHLLKLALAELADIPASSSKIEAKVKVVQELVKHHVKEEERDLLPKLKDCGVNMEELGKQIMQRKKRIMSQIQKVGDKSGRQIGGSPRKSGVTRRSA